MINWNTLDSTIDRIIAESTYENDSYLPFARSLNESEQNEVLRHMEENRGDISQDDFMKFKNSFIYVNNEKIKPQVNTVVIMETEAQKAAREAALRAKYSLGRNLADSSVTNPSKPPAINPNVDIYAGMKLPVPAVIYNKYISILTNKGYDNREAQEIINSLTKKIFLYPSIGGGTIEQQIEKAVNAYPPKNLLETPALINNNFMMYGIIAVILIALFYSFR